MLTFSCLGKIFFLNHIQKNSLILFVFDHFIMKVAVLALLLVVNIPGMSLTLEFTLWCIVLHPAVLEAIQSSEWVLIIRYILIILDNFLLPLFRF